ncbi:MAG: circadian clock protein KaiC [Acidobacteriota bacterium]|jgi:circadian clock protein KaiC|nr:circadian clock protein KaiC [Acidobacteriota bacterium]
MPIEPGKREIAPTGIAGLDDVLNGGLTRNRVYLVQGDPGVGKTTLGLQFLLEGARQGEACLYLTLSETREEIEEVADSHHWSLDSINIFEYSAGARLESEEESTLFHPSEVELGQATRTLLQQVEKVKPTRVVFDSLSEIRLLAQNPLRYRRQILGLKQYFAGRNCTVLLLDDKNTGSGGDMQLMTLAHGVIMLEQLAPVYGAERRRLRVSKLRGLRYRGGFHDFTIRSGGIVVYPRLIASEHREAYIPRRMASGIPAIDSLLGGGIDRGTSTLIMGPAGSGKSALSTQYVVAAAERGENVAIFAFDESRGTLFARSAAINMDLSPHVESGRVTVQQIDPAEIPPGEFVHLVREAVEERHVSIVVIDSLNGYMNAMPEEHFLTIQMHEMLTYLGQKGVATILVVAQHGVVGSTMVSPVDVSYLADSVILLRYFELAGEIRKAVSVVKKRSGQHEKAIRQLTMGSEGLAVGPPLTEFRGVLSGTPLFTPMTVSGTERERESEGR